MEVFADSHYLAVGHADIFEDHTFLGGILGALTVYILLRPQMFWLTDRKRMRRSIMAILLLCETLLIFLIPLSFVVWMMISKLQAINLDPRNLMDGIEHVAGLIQQKTGYELLSKGNVNTIVSALPRVGQMLMEGITNFAINVLVLLFVLYFMLIGGKKMERYITESCLLIGRTKRIYCVSSTWSCAPTLSGCLSWQ